MTKKDFSGCITAKVGMRVPFHDVDPAHVVWHGRYFKYFEEARRTLLEELDYSYEAMMKSGFIWPIADATVRYVRPLMLDQRFEVTAALREWELRMVIDYRIVSEDGVLYTKGRTVQVPIDAATMELCFGTPDELIAKIEKRLAAGA